MRWLSASRLKADDLCPARSQIREPQTPAMERGLRRHKFIETRYLGTPWPVDDDLADELRAADARPGFFPPRDWAIDVEGHGLPPSVSQEMYNRPMGHLILVPDRIGIRFVADLLVLDPSEPDCLIIADWKGQTEEDHTIQASVYFWCYSHPELYGDMARFRFEARSVPSGRIERYEYSIDQRADVEAILIEMCERVLDRESRGDFPAKLNRWCSSCSISATCPEYNSAVTTPPSEAATLPAAKLFELPTEFASLVELRQRMQMLTAITDELKGRVDDQLKMVLAGGPVALDGKTWKLVERATRYEVDAESAFALCDNLEIDVDKVVEVSHSKYKLAVEQRLAQLKKGKDPREARAREWFAESRKARKTSVITCSQAKGPRVDVGDEPVLLMDGEA